MPRFLNPPTMPEPMSLYSQAVVVGTAYKRVIISGQLGVLPDGTLAEGLEAQMEQAFDNFLAGVAAADLTAEDIVGVTAYCTVRGSVALYRLVRDRKFGKAVPAATYLEVAGLASPAHLFEIAGEALREAPLRV
jgi:2-iminobutanoate/2-iminopropanoate deaminase